MARVQTGGAAVEKCGTQYSVLRQSDGSISGPDSFYSGNRVSFFGDTINTTGNLSTPADPPTTGEWIDLPDNLGDAFEALTATGSFPAEATRRAVVSGSAEPGATITIKNGATVVATVIADSSGDYSIGVPAPNKGGVLNLTVTQTVDGQAGGSQNVSLDYGRAVLVTDPADQDEASGNTAIAGAGEPGSSVQVFDNAGRTPIVSATVRADGRWSSTAPLSNGEHVLEAKQMSKGANTTTSTVTVNPGETAAELSAAGRFDAQDATKPATAFGSAPTGATVILRNAAGTEIGRTVAVDNAYEITIDPKKAQAGVNTFSAVIAGDASNAKSFTLDYGQAGTGVIVTTPAKNGTVAEGVVEFRGSGQVGAKVVVRGSSREVARGTVNAQGAWTATSSMAMAKGSYDLYFDQVTKGGLTNTVRHAFTVGTVTPPIAQHTVTSPTSGETVETLRPTFEGTGHNGATITVRGSSRVLGTGTVTNGRWTVQTGMDLAPGTYNLYVDQSVGGTVTGTVRAEFTVSAAAFRELTLTSPEDGESVKTLRPTFVGTATPGAEIRIGSSRTVVATATVGQDGTFRTTASIDLARGGSYNLEVKQTTKSGKTSTVQAPFTIDRTAQ
ncbi:Ig-like domain-containing protein [Curtobacterium sp. UNCCL20]|uniref:Ig-like domain-containing protein n=1 Tax=Curtobacterium sp. UNCCL20 TaxID=1502773 RepID=UPI002675C718|nr:Ig-like domain-containing protein [Curtobacterium sp. UNCCL20]